MIKNKEVKHFLFIQILLFGILILMTAGIHKILFWQYKKAFVENNATLVGNLLEKHPELEDEIIDILLTPNLDTNGKSILQQYGLADTESIDYLDHIHKLDQKLWYYLLAIVILLFLGELILYIIFILLQYKKIRQIDQYMINVLNGDYRMSIKDYTEGDLSNLQNDIYKLTIRLKEKSDRSLSDKKALESTLSDISHQIKTPLTSMYVMNDLLETELDLQKRKEFLTKNRMQLERIEWLVSSLLKMSRLDSGTIALKQEAVSSKELLTNALEPILIPIELKEMEVVFQIEEFSCELDFHWTREAFVNLIKNAYEHTPSKGILTLSATQNPLYYEFQIKDTGEGISKKDLPHIFERFYKGEHNKDSIGIGLNMALMIIKKQGGDIMVQSIQNQGTTFTIRFYRNII